MTLFKTIGPPRSSETKAIALKLKPFKLGWLDRIFAFLLWTLAFLFIAGLVHIVSIFALPELAQKKDAYSRLQAVAQIGHLTLLSASLPGHEYAPFTDPAVVQAVCLFDLDRGPLAFSADTLQDGLLTLSFRTRTGRVFYSMTDRAALHGKIDVNVMTAKQLEAAEADDDEDDPPQELRLTSSEKKGFILINALVSLPSERASIEALVTSMSCDIDEDTGK